MSQRMDHSVDTNPPIALHLHPQAMQVKALQEVLDTLITKPHDHSVLVKCGGPRLDPQSKGGRSDLKQQRMSQVKPHMILTQSISVVFFMLDTSPQLPKLDLCPQLYGKSPWRFHHVIESEAAKQSTSRSHARQEHYELVPDLPLFSAANVHYGKQLLRINIFTHDHPAMVTFYSNLFGHSPVFEKENFTIFSFPYTKELTVQLSLKGDSQIIPYPLDEVDVVFSLVEIPKLQNLKIVSEDLYTVNDPDDNVILLKQLPSTAGGIRGEMDTQSTYSSIRGEMDTQSTYSSIGLTSDPEKLLTMEIEDQKWNASNCDADRPDVIPKQDSFIAPRSSMKTTRVPTNFTSSRQRSGSPANLRKLVIHTSSTLSISASKDMQPEKELNNNVPVGRRRDSVDIVATF